MNRSKRMIYIQVEDKENNQIVGAETTMSELKKSKSVLREMVNTLNRKIDEDIEIVKEGESKDTTSGNIQYGENGWMY